MKEFIIKYKIVIFFTCSAILGYLPWLITGEPTWFMLGMPITGIILTLITKGMPGIIDQLKSAIHIKAPILEYVKIIALLTSLNVITLLIAFLLYRDVPGFSMIKTEPLSIPLLLLLILWGGPIFEEVFGLRGFALPELLKTKTPLVCSIIIGTFFGAWHLVEFFRPGSTQYAIGIQYYPLFIVSEIALSILMTSFYIRNNNNLFLAGIFFHWMMNSTAVLFQTDVTFSNAQNAPQMNIHYFVIYSILLFVFSLFVVIKSKLYKSTLR